MKKYILTLVFLLVCACAHRRASYESRTFQTFEEQYENKEVTAFRLFLLKHVQSIIARGLGILGVSAPERM